MAMSNGVTLETVSEFVHILPSITSVGSGSVTGVGDSVYHVYVTDFLTMMTLLWHGFHDAIKMGMTIKC